MKMPQDIKEFFEKFSKDAVKMKEQTPDMVNGFGGFFSKVMGEGSITALEKQLIAVGVAVAANCSHCIRPHVKKSLEAGATRQQILEPASVAVVMTGGQVYTHIPVVINP